MIPTTCALRSAAVFSFTLLLLLAPSGVFSAQFKLGLVFDKGGKDDRSFNSSAYQGALKAKEELGVFVKYVEATDDSAFEPALRAFAQKNFDLIIGVGVSQAEAVSKVAAKFPDKHFAIVDAEVKAPNVRSLLFEEHEGSFLIGALAAASSKSGNIGFIGGMDIPLIRRFEMAYVAGAKNVSPKISVKSNFIGVTGEAWNNPAKAKEIALSQFDSGADVIFAAAGASNAGLFDAAEERVKFAIGVDSNQNWIKPGRVLTSMLKRVDKAVFAVCKDSVQGKFSGGARRFGLANEGIDYAMDEFNKNLISKATLSRVEKLKADIVAGRIRVPDFYRKK